MKKVTRVMEKTASERRRKHLASCSSSSSDNDNFIGGNDIDGDNICMKQNLPNDQNGSNYVNHVSNNANFSVTNNSKYSKTSPKHDALLLAAAADENNDAESVFSLLEKVDMPAIVSPNSAAGKLPTVQNSGSNQNSLIDVVVDSNDDNASFSFSYVDDIPTRPKSGSASVASSSATSLSDYLESSERSVNAASKPHLPWHTKIRQNNRNDNEVDQLNIDDLASYYDVKDDASLVSRLSFIVKHSKKLPTKLKNHQSSNLTPTSSAHSKTSIYSTAQPLYHDRNEEADENDGDGSWYDPDTMQRLHRGTKKQQENMSNISLENHQPKATFTTMIDEFTNYQDQMKNELHHEFRHELDPDYIQRNPLSSCCPSVCDKDSSNRMIYAGISIWVCLFAGILLFDNFSSFKSRTEPHAGATNTLVPLTMAPPDLMRILYECTSTNPPTTSEQYSHCEELCLTASCCIESNQEDSYCFDTSTEACLSYQPCMLIHPVFGMLTREAASMVVPFDDDISVNANVITEVCQPESYRTELGRMQCDNYCSPSSCCFSDSFGCWDSQNTYSIGVYGSHLCNLYMECLVVFVNGKIEDNDVDESSSSSLDFISETVNQRCDTAAWKDQGDVDVCQDLCLPSQCCFTSVAQYNCLDTHVDLCAAYSSCTILPILHDGGGGELVFGPGSGSGSGIMGENDNRDSFQGGALLAPTASPTISIKNDDGLDVTGETAQLICNGFKWKSREDVELCENFCKPYQCCFDGTISCTENFQVHSLCATHAVCTVAYDGTTMNSPFGSKALEEGNKSQQLCNPALWQTRQDVTTCNDLCEPFRCCFEVSDSCLHDISEAPLCELHSFCIVAHNGTTMSKLFGPEALIDDDNGADENNDAPSTTLDNLNPLHVTELNPAQVLEQTVESVCLIPSSAIQPTNRVMRHEDGDHTLLCEEVCQPAQCCFYSDTTNCWDSLVLMCDIFASCGTLGNDLFALTTSLTDAKHSEESTSINGPVNVTIGEEEDVKEKEMTLTNTLNVIEDVVQMACGANTGDALKNEKEMQQLCEEICMMYSCCFINGNDDNVSGCQDPVTAIFCPSYKACSVLY